MKIKTHFAILLSAATLAVAGVAVAQTTNSTNTTITSTPGAGCTATGNAMRAGNLGGSASPNVCNDGAGKTTAAATGTTTSGSTAATTGSPSTSNSTTLSGNSGSTSTGMADSGTLPSRSAIRVARADRG